MTSSTTIRNLLLLSVLLPSVPACSVGEFNAETPNHSIRTSSEFCNGFRRTADRSWGHNRFMLPIFLLFAASHPSRVSPVTLLADAVGESVPSKKSSGVDEANSPLIARYTAAVRIQAAALRGVDTEMEITAKVPKLHRESQLRTLRRTSIEGQIRFETIASSGDNGVKREIIARYLDFESQSAPVNDSKSIGPVKPGLYKFRLKNTFERAGRIIHIFQIEPRKKAMGLFKGELWIDDETGMPLRESGQLVKTPSIVFKKIRFVREYEIREGISIPKRTMSTAETRLAGTVQLNICYRNFACTQSGEYGIDTPPPLGANWCRPITRSEEELCR